VSDDWTPDDAFLESDDPEAQAREQRRQEREARRRERESKQDPTEAPSPRASSAEPPSPGASSAEGAAGGGAEGVPPPQRRLPSSPAREPFAQRITAMRKRLAASRPRRSPREPRPGSGGPGGGPDLIKAAVGNWRRIAAQGRRWRPGLRIHVLRHDVSRGARHQDQGHNQSPIRSRSAASVRVAQRASLSDSCGARPPPGPVGLRPL